jgi:uncharacterized membrane protein
MADNPYAPPKTRVQDVPETLPDGDFLPEGRGVPAGNGWRWIADAWTFMSAQRWTFIGVCLLLLLIQLVAQFIPLVGPIAVALVYPVLVGGFLLGCEAVRRGESLEVGHLFAGFQRHAGKLIALGALSLALGILIVIVMFAILGTSIAPMLLSGAQPTPEQAAAMLVPLLLFVLVVLALSIPISMAYLFAPPLIVLNDYTVGQALKASFVVCLKNILSFLVWGIAMFVLAIPASILLFLGWILLLPVLMVSLYMSYRDIFHET